MGVRMMSGERHRVLRGMEGYIYGGSGGCVRGLRVVLGKGTDWGTWRSRLHSRDRSKIDKTE
jgi:hypothetical protein